MDEKMLEERLAEELIQPWQVLAAGNGFLVVTDWRLPDDEHIEIHVRNVGDRGDLFLVTDGGEVVNTLFSHGVDLTRDPSGSRMIERAAERYGVKIVEGQMVRGAGEGDLHHAVRMVLEAVKEASCMLWHKLEPPGQVH